MDSCPVILDMVVEDSSEISKASHSQILGSISDNPSILGDTRASSEERYFSSTYPKSLVRILILSEYESDFLVGNVFPPPNLGGRNLGGKNGGNLGGKDGGKDGGKNGGKNGGNLGGNRGGKNGGGAGVVIVDDAVVVPPDVITETVTVYVVLPLNPLRDTDVPLRDTVPPVVVTK